MKIFKKIVTVTATLALTVGMCSNVFAATWGSYFGASSGWYEGAEGKLSSQSEDGWTATMTAIGYGGCWGGQVYQDTSKKTGKVEVKKGQKYHIECTLESSNCDKWVLIKVATGDTYAYGKWVHLKKGQATKVNEDFTATADANSIYFGIGGEFGDRTGIDEDAEARYSYASETPKDDDPTYATKVTCKGFVLEEVGASSSDKKDSGSSTSGQSSSSKSTKTSSSSSVATGDFTPIACGMAAMIAAAAIVVFSRKRETE